MVAENGSYSEKSRPNHGAKVGPLIWPDRSMTLMDPVAIYPTVMKETAFRAQKQSTTRKQMRKTQKQNSCARCTRGGHRERRSCEEWRKDAEMRG